MLPKENRKACVSWAPHNYNHATLSPKPRLPNPLLPHFAGLPQHVPVKCAAFLASFIIDCSFCPAQKKGRYISHMLHGKANPESRRKPTTKLKWGRFRATRGTYAPWLSAVRQSSSWANTAGQEKELKRKSCSKGSRCDQKQGERARRALILNGSVGELKQSPLRV